MEFGWEMRVREVAVSHFSKRINTSVAGSMVCVSGYYYDCNMQWVRRVLDYYYCYYYY